MSRLSAVVQLIDGVFTGLNSSRDSSSVTSLMRPAGFPEHESVHSRARGQITLGSPLLFRGESSATAARISRRAQAAAAVAARSANESRCVWPLSSRPDAPTLGQSISRARAPAGTLPSVTHAPGSDRSGLDT